MIKSKKTALFLLCFIILLERIQLVASDVGAHGQQKPLTFHGIVSDTLSLIKQSHKNSWEKIKTIVHDVQLHFSAPNLDFRPPDTGNNKGEKHSVGEDMKAAAKKSVETEKATVKETAKAAGEAMHKTAKKVKNSVSDSDENDHDEL